VFDRGSDVVGRGRLVMVDENAPQSPGPTCLSSIFPDVINPRLNFSKGAAS
jgi:hypothetical protein